ncbi:hypothetical protein PF005_g1920 [Phytophthora fragariae]|uniref:Uncharacterized protein n=1 Tax=Phytophthora fragariae TaxID=53985 RepID=A0A6A3UU59_9STRA|nr:hypothetical protein PF003_g27245 [Phytophthora fragariae]KAE8948425.1 hypothetical protein PF009_g2002 [Phytophthora fragariae]KAE9027716.1 hypothetical protein PF011_g1901 [Phytophthora fragariae]KAE9132957.1 hypothetical protein PF010_g2995 [Phytophthora fragariae]KAE9136858.1 hypothetical protein PF007_g2037 [Phytophthora fragariae]
MAQEDPKRDVLQRLRRHLASERSVSLYEALTAHALDAATGGVLFLGGVSAAQVAQKLLRVGSASGFLLPQALGVAAVGASSVAALHLASAPREVFQELAAQQKQQRGWSWSWSGRDLQPPTAWRLLRSKARERWEDLPQAPYPVYAAMGLLCFKLLGGRPNALAPSPFADLGAFHLKKASLPATAEYATGVERGVIQQFGRLYGCHTCGVKRGVRYHADHMPPKLVAKRRDEQFFRKLLGRTTAFRFYPQCESCSNQQSSVVKQWKSTLKMHLLSLRAYHATGLWLVLLCTGGLYVGGSNFHETSEVSAAAAMEDAPDAPGAFTSSDFSLLVSLRERERKLRRERGKLRDPTQIAAIEEELQAVAQCKAAVKADIKRQRAN